MTSDRSDERSKQTREQLERLRLRLLDLTGRNRFLNFRHSETARNQLRVVSASIEQVVAITASGSEFQVKGLRKPADLMPELDQAAEDDAEPTSPFKAARRTRRFNPQAMADVARASGIDPSFDLPMSSELSRNRDLQSLLFFDELERKLQGLYDEQRRFLQELGINTLYCCIGFLEWYEADHSDKLRLSPLLLYPSEIKRLLAGTKYQFRLSGIDADPETNISLIERLTQDFGIRLPEYDPEVSSAATYLIDVEKAIIEQKRWRVRNFATFAILNFAKLAMFRDLDPNERPKDALLEDQEVISDILAGLEHASDGIVDEAVDKPEIASLVPLLVTEADSSQFAAIAEALSGKSLVIEGPPGTGKSQTITNIIAASLANGLRVLFVAEKLAALQVVKSKLDSYNLGPFCLELHSTKARKVDVHKSLSDRIYLARPARPDVETLIASINQQKNVLASYTMALHSTFGKLGPSLHDLLWREQRVRLEIGTDASKVEHFVVPRAIDFDPLRLTEVAQALDAYQTTFEAMAAAHGSVKNHPWHGIVATDATLDQRQTFLQRFRDACAIIGAFNEEIYRASRHLGIREGLTVRDSLALVELAAGLYSAEPGVPRDALSELRKEPNVAVLIRFAQNLEELHTLEHERGRNLLRNIASLMPELSEAVAALDTVALWELQIGSFGEARSAHNAQIKLLSGLQEYLKQLAMVTNSGSHAALLAITSCAALISSTSRAVLVNRSASLMSEENAVELERLVADGSRLKAERAVFEGEFDLRDLPDWSSLRSISRDLRAGGRLWWLNADVRHARRLYRRHSLRAHRANNTHIAETFSAIATHMDETETFSNEPRFAALLGESFRGIETDFALLSSILSFADGSRAITSGAAPWDDGLRQSLLHGSIEALDRIVALVQDTRCEAARHYTESAEFEGISGAIKDIERCISLNDRFESALSPLSLPPNTTVGRVVDLLADARSHLELTLKIEGDGGAKSILHEAFSGTSTVPSLLRSGIAYASQINVASLPERVKDKLASVAPGDFTSALEILADIYYNRRESITNAIAALERHVYLNCHDFFGAGSLSGIALAAVCERTSRANARAETLDDWIRYARLRNRALEFSSHDLIALFEGDAPGLSTSLSELFKYVVVRSVVRAAIDEKPELRDFPGVTLNQARTNFQALDRELIAAYRKKLAGQLRETPVDLGNSTGPRGSWTGKALITHEIGKKKRHIALRDLVRRAGTAIQQLKPCFMMSPLSVAQYIAPGTIEFDLVVIDEASQMKPEDALGALSRAKRVVVVGDPKQLPPTSFFDRQFDDDDVPDEDVVESESILDLAISQYGKRRLRWHYRSRHESLIAFSNRYFYDNDLIVFPSPDKAAAEFGVRSNYVAGLYKNGVNPVEGRAVAEAAIRLMHSQPELSLGVVAVNREQRDFINDELDRMIANDSVAAEYVARWENTLFPYFTKNLESVQGDERDVIIISTVYGPEEPGRPVAQRFGPILGPSGWRRLNVLFTRARVKVELFTSMKPSDIRADQVQSGKGVLALRNYLDYALTGRLETGSTSRRPPDSDFEIAVARMLETKGFDVEAQVGVSHYFIDLAIRNPRNGSYLLGIECDGATYHSAKSARDRDRTREEALRTLGWQLYRIWSTDWFADPRREFAKLDNYLQSLLSETP